MGWGLSSTGDIFPPAKDKNNLGPSEGLLLKYKSYRKNIEARRQPPAHQHVLSSIGYCREVGIGSGPGLRLRSPVAMSIVRLIGWGLSSTGDIFPPAKDKNNLCYSEGLRLKYKSYRKNIEARRQPPAHQHVLSSIRYCREVGTGSGLGQG